MAFFVCCRNSAIREALPSGTDFKKAKPTDFQPVSRQPSPIPGHGGTERTRELC